MFNISFKVGPAKLAETLARLQAITGHYEVKHIGGEAAPAASTANGSNSPKAVKVRRHTRAYRRNPESGPTAHQQAVTMLGQYGPGPFKIRDLLDRAERQGISSPVVYRALKQEIDAGNVTKLEPGSYQRTTAGFGRGLLQGQAS